MSIQFSPTAFTDPLLTFLLITACAAVATQKPSLSGLLFGLALLTKYQAVLFLPLLLGLGWLAGWRSARWGRWLVGLLPPLVALFAWDFARSGRFGLWHNQIGNFGGVRLSYSWEIWPRLWAWVELWQTAVAPLIFLLLILAIGWSVIQICQVCRRPDRSQPADHLILIFLLGYGLFHWLIAIPVWDRYLLPLLPLLAILLARAFDELLIRRPSMVPTLQAGAGVFLALVLISASWAARNGRTPLGSSPQSDQGAATIAAALADAPYGTVLYDHWFSWQWRYHLFDKRVFVSWFPHADALAADLAAFGQDGAPRYLALPNADMAQPIRRTVQEAGFTLTVVTQSNQIILYEIKPLLTRISQIKPQNLCNLRNLWINSGRHHATV